MNIGETIAGLKQGKNFARQGWNGKEMYISINLPKPQDKITEPFVYMKTADNKFIPWLCSQADLLAEDWEEKM